ncbi:glycosyltransferase family 2 protein [Candidatus Roizmanbacteria bacterium]|nr:glycosyltransferase family 2 protein [Candidatus Roizmanbacteria bacterium]
MGRSTMKELLVKRHTGNKSKVTVIITVHNYEDYIIQCLNSVFQQTINHIDLIVYDDCSSDNSTIYIKQWVEENASRFENILVARHRENKGLSTTRNECFELATTPYVFVLDADNTIYPRCLELLKSAIDKTDADFAYSYARIHNGKKSLLNIYPWNPQLLFKENYIDAMVMLKKSTWSNVGGYSIMENLGWEDYDLWLKIHEYGGWATLVPEILCEYRVHTKSMISTNTGYNTDRLWQIIRSQHRRFFSKYEKNHQGTKNSAWYQTQIDILTHSSKLLEQRIKSTTSHPLFQKWQKYCEWKRKILAGE